MTESLADVFLSTVANPSAAQVSAEEEEPPRGSVANEATAFPTVPGLVEHLKDILKCPITRRPMTMPVLAGDGWTYDFEALVEHVEELQACNERVVSPKTHRPMRYVKLKPNMVVRRLTGLVTKWDEMARAGAALPNFSEAMERIRQELLCPISGEQMLVPVLAADGCSYEADAICDWLNYCQDRGVVPTSPLSNLPLLETILVPNYIVFEPSKKDAAGHEIATSHLLSNGPAWRHSLSPLWNKMNEFALEAQ